MSKKTALAGADAKPTARQLFIPITRVDEEKREVWGYATTDQVDTFGTLFPFEASKRAYAEWNDNFERLTDGESKGNLRAMHQKIAAGKVIACDPDEEKRGIYVGAHVVDDKEWEKVKQRVYTGFSHGVTQTSPSVFERRNGKLIEIVPEFFVNELSLADKPSCPGAVMTLFRRAEDPPADDAAPAAAADAPIPPAADTASPEPPETPPAATPTTVPVIAATPAAPIVAPVSAAAAPPPADVDRVAVALKFDAKKFMPEAAVNWARAHDFLVRTAPEPEPNATHIQIEQRNAKDFCELQSVPLADGVELVSGQLKTDSAAARMGEILRLVEPEILRAAQSEEYTILPSLTALAALCQAISSVMYSYPSADGVTEAQKADIGSLTLAAESILDFIGSRLAGQLSSLTSNAERLAQGELERFTQLPQVLSRGQLERLMSDKGMQTNVLAMHDVGHALCDATMKMGIECSAGKCPSGESEQERLIRVTPPPIPRAGFPSPQEVGLRHTTGGKTAPARPVQRTAAPAPAAIAATAPEAAPTAERISSPTGNDQVLQAIAQVTEQVNGLMTRIASVDERMQQVASLPAPIGRPPAAPIEKTLAGAAPTADRLALSAELQRMAESMTDPAVKVQLVLRAAALQAPGASNAGQARKP
jgi:hypothetical protein